MSESEPSAVNESAEDQAFDSLTPSESGSSVSGSSVTGPIKSKIAKPSSLKLSNTASPSRISRPCTQAPKPALPPLPNRSKPSRDPETFAANFVRESQAMVQQLAPIPDDENCQPLILGKPSFSEKEKTVLLDVVEHYKDIVSSQKTDFDTVKKQAAAWEKIQMEFSVLMQNGTYRSSMALKSFWENSQPQPKIEAKSPSPQENNQIAVIPENAPVAENSQIAVIPENSQVVENSQAVPENSVVVAELWQVDNERQLAKVKLEQEQMKLQLLKLEVLRKTAELYRDYPDLNHDNEEGASPGGGVFDSFLRMRQGQGPRS